MPQKNKTQDLFPYTRRALREGKLTEDHLEMLRQEIRFRHDREAIALMLELPDGPFRMMMADFTSPPEIRPDLVAALLKRAGKLGCIDKRLAHSSITFAAEQQDPATFGHILDLAVKYRDDLHNEPLGGFINNTLQTQFLNAIDRIKDRGTAAILARQLPHESQRFSRHLRQIRKPGRFISSPKPIYAVIAMTGGDILAATLEYLQDTLGQSEEWSGLFTQGRHAELARFALAQKLPLEEVLFLRTRDIRARRAM